MDVFVRSIPYYAAAERDLRRVELPDGISRLVLSPESLAVFELLVFRDEDLVDLRRLVAVQGDALDVARLRREVAGMVGAADERVEAGDRIVREQGSA